MVPLPGPTSLTTKDKGASAPWLEHPPRTGDESLRWPGRQTGDKTRFWVVLLCTGAWRLWETSPSPSSLPLSGKDRERLMLPVAAPGWRRRDGRMRVGLVIPNQAAAW